ncbi:MAG TPA: hypothetical protein VF881_06860 [Polyangiaceae bacterium]
MLGADPVPTEIALARRLFTEARAAEDVRDWRSATAKLRDAISIKETAGLRFHLAYCEEQQGMLVEALVDYERSEDLATGSNDDLRKQVPAKRESLHKRIPTVTLLVPPDSSPNASVSVDGHVLPAAALGKPIPVNPGKHTLVVSRPDYAPFTTEVFLNETDAVVTNAIMVRTENGDAVSPLSMRAKATSGTDSIAHSSRPGLQARTYVLIGEATIGAAALAVGIGYMIAASSADARLDAAHEKLGTMGCPDKDPILCAELQPTLDDARNDRFIAGLSFIGAGVGAASFVATFLLWPAQRSKVAIIPSFQPKSATLSVAGSF